MTTSDITPAPAVPVTPAATPWEYAPAPESTDVVRLRERYGLFVGGSFVEPAGDAWFPTISPATEDTLAEVAEAGDEDVDTSSITRAGRTSSSTPSRTWSRSPSASPGRSSRGTSLC
jgi:aldehyde dehydrogenase (NAD+)